MLELFHHCFSDEAPDIAGYYKGAGSGLRRHIKNRTADPDMKSSTFPSENSSPISRGQLEPFTSSAEWR